MGMLNDDEVRARLEYHPPTDDTRPAYELSRSLVRLLFEVWNEVLPPGREAALTLTALEEAHSWANAAVARRAGPDWRLEPIDVSELVDDVLEHLEGPLHLRSRVVGSGGALPGSNGGDIGPEEPSIAAESDGSAEIVPESGLAATHLSPEAVQGLVERHGSLGPADQLARRTR